MNKETTEEIRKFMDKMKKRRNWKHTLECTVHEIYHKCTTCKLPIGESVVVVYHRKPSGDDISVYCSLKHLKDSLVP